MTYSDKITSHLWSIFGVSEIVLTFICLGFSLIGGIKCWTAMTVYTLIAAPFAEIAQGLIVKEIPYMGRNCRLGYRNGFGMLCDR